MRNSIGVKRPNHRGKLLKTHKVDILQYQHSAHDQTCFYEKAVDLATAKFWLIGPHRNRAKPQHFGAACAVAAAQHF